MSKPKVLILDIETSPIISYTWGLFDQNIGLNQVKEDWHVLSWAAKWLGEPKVFYRDQSKAKKLSDDREILKEIWALLDDADVVVTQNGRKFDCKKLNARFVFHGMKPPAPYKHQDTLEIARRKFGFTSNKLAYMADKLCTKYKKLEHQEFPGFELWKECLAGNKKAWAEMKKYNIHDVLATEELYTKLRPWDNSLNFNLWREDGVERCKCGSTEFQHRGFLFTTTGKYQRFQCKKCGAWSRSGTNLFSHEEKLALKRHIP